MHEYGPLPIISIEGIVAFPETEQLIYVSDEKTINLIKSCLQSDSPLGVFSEDTLTSNMGPSNLGVGCLAELKIEKTSSNGSLYVWLRMIEKVTLTRVVQEIPHALYHYQVTPDVQDTESKIFNGHIIRKLKSRLIEWSQQNIDDSIERAYFLAKLTGLRSITNYACMHLIESTELKQQLLENISLYNRVHLISILIDRHHGQEQVIKKAMIDYVTIEQTTPLAH